MTSRKTLAEIDKVMNEIENCNGYKKSKEMLDASTNWLTILKDCRNTYDTLDEKDFEKINFIFVNHYLNYSNMMFHSIASDAYKSIMNVLLKITEKHIDNLDKLE
jgi:hypothetical protein